MMDRIVEILRKFPGISEVEILDEEIISFKCCEETSLACIAGATDGTQEWYVETHVDTEKLVSVHYWIMYSALMEERDWHLETLVGKLNEGLEQCLPIVLELVYPPHNLGVPDLGLVTMEQIVRELDRRDHQFVLIWQDKDYEQYKAGGEQEELIRLLKNTIESMENGDERV